MWFLCLLVICLKLVSFYVFFLQNDDLNLGSMFDGTAVRASRNETFGEVLF